MPRIQSLGFTPSATTPYTLPSHLDFTESSMPLSRSSAKMASHLTWIFRSNIPLIHGDDSENLKRKMIFHPRSISFAPAKCHQPTPCKCTTDTADTIRTSIPDRQNYSLPRVYLSIFQSIAHDLLPLIHTPVSYRSALLNAKT